MLVDPETEHPDPADRIASLFDLALSELDLVVHEDLFAIDVDPVVSTALGPTKTRW